MPRRRRRSRWRRSWSRALPVVAPVAVVAVAAAILAGGWSQVGSSSGSYRRTVDRGYASLAGAVIRRSTDTGTVLTAVLGGVATAGRVSLFAGLESVAADTARQERSFAAIVPPAPVGSLAEICRGAVLDRRDGSAALARAVENALGGSAGVTPTDPATTLTQIENAVATIRNGDSDWAACRQQLRRAPGGARVPASQWAADPGVWGAQALAAMAGELRVAPGLAAYHALSVTAVRTDPPALVTTGAGLLPPTSAVTVYAVVTDAGNVDEPSVQIEVTLDPMVPGAAPVSRSVTVALGAGRSVTAVLGPVAVHPGTAYSLGLSAVPRGPGATSSNIPLSVAAEPTTTTTTTAPPSTTTTTRPTARPGGTTTRG